MNNKHFFLKYLLSVIVVLFFSCQTSLAFAAGGENGGSVGFYGEYVFPTEESEPPLADPIPRPKPAPVPKSKIRLPQTNEVKPSLAIIAGSILVVVAVSLKIKQRGVVK